MWGSPVPRPPLGARVWRFPALNTECRIPCAPPALKVTAAAHFMCSFCMYARMYVCVVYVCMHACLCACMYFCVYVCLHACMDAKCVAPCGFVQGGRGTGGGGFVCVFCVCCLFVLLGGGARSHVSDPLTTTATTPRCTTSHLRAPRLHAPPPPPLLQASCPRPTATCCWGWWATA